ncbi:hypothetical protein ACXR0O_08315 [Verrucomicrobiota bacterium sgz303538]
MRQTPVSPVRIHTTKVRNHRSAPDRLTRFERQISAFLKGHPHASTFDVATFLCPDFFNQSPCARTTLWQEVATTLSRMLARGLVSMKVDDVQLACWALEPAAAN